MTELLSLMLFFIQCEGKKLHHRNKSLCFLLLIERVGDVIHSPLPIRGDHPGVGLEVVLLNFLQDFLLLKLLQAVSDYFL